MSTTTTTATVIPSRFGFFVGYRAGATVHAFAADGARHFGTPELVASADGVKVYSSPEGAGRALRRELLALLEGRHPEAAIVHGWDHAGAGPAIFGWWAKGPCAARYLGRTLHDAVRR